MMRSIIVLMFLSLCMPVMAEDVLDFYYDLEKQELSLLGVEDVLEENPMLVIYRNGISVLKEKDYDFDEIKDTPIVLKAKEKDLLRIEIWGENGLAYSEEIIAGENQIKAVAVKEEKPKKPVSILISDEPPSSDSVLVGDEPVEEEVVEEPAAPSYGYKENGSRGPGDEGYGYKKEDDVYEGHGSYGYKLEEKEYEPYGYKDFGYESKDPQYGRDEY